MKSIMARREVWIPIAILAFASAAYLFRSILFTLLVEPIGWLLWMGWRLLASIDQAVCWTLVVMISVALVLRRIPVHPAAHEQGTPAQGLQQDAPSRLEHWEGLARRGRQSRSGDAALQASLTVLVDQVAESARLVPPEHLQAAARDGRLARLIRLLPGSRRREDQRALESQLTWMESALEIKDEQSTR